MLGHDVENLTAGVGGPQEAAILHSVDRLAPVAALLDVDRLEQVRRETPGRHRAGHPAVGTPTRAGGRTSPVASRAMMGMGGPAGRDSDRRRRMVAMVIVFAMVLAAGATLLSIVLL